MYKNAQNAGPQASQPGPDNAKQGNTKSGSDEVTDVDFEEVK
jgi:hypothetical protein